MSENERVEWSNVSLNCLDGGPAPAPLLEHWRGYQGLPPQARAHIWEILVLAFDQPPGPAMAEQLQRFARAYGCTETAAQEALEVCRFVTTRAIALDLPLAAFRQDLERLSGEGTDGVEELCAKYEDIGTRRRAEIIRASLLDHGRLLTDIRWRIDTVAASNRASGIATPVVHLTLSYQEGHGPEAERGHLTLQMLPESTAQLRALCDQIDATMARGLPARP